MSNRRNDFMDLHPVSVIGSFMGARPQQGFAAQDAEPEAYEPREGFARRLVAAVRGRRETATAATRRAST
jgi:hypothetical protein